VISGLETIEPQGPEEWTPRNMREEAVDQLTLRQALIESNNRAAVALQQGIGSRPILRLASDAGLRGQPDVPSLALGSGLVTPLDLTAAYAVFPNGGYRVTPRAIVRILDQQGDTALDEPVQRDRVLPDTVAFQMVSLMRDVIDRGTATGVRQWGVRFPVGGKTGTTNESKDAWFVGYSSAIVVGVWVGFDQPGAAWRSRSGPISCGAPPACCGPGTSQCPPDFGRPSSAGCRTCGRSRAVPRTPNTSRQATRSRVGCARSTRARSSSGRNARSKALSPASEGACES
jgi:penicillin-binding protein 1A